MRQNKLSTVVICLLSFAFVYSGLIAYNHQDTTPHNPPGQQYQQSIPLVRTYLPAIDNGQPVAKRDVSVRYFLQPSVRIQSGQSYGSGTICYYDEETGDAYVISCGHLFNGTKEPNGRGTRTAHIDVFYKNNRKLNEPQRFRADVICYDRKEDISLLRFRPDWQVEHYFPIAPAKYLLRQGDVLESTGCDSSQEVAAYTVEIVEGMNTGQNLVTKGNSPRSGRSGGGLLSNDGYYLAIVWGTSALDGSGYGFYVPLRRIHKYFSKWQETDWILKVSNYYQIINTIPIIGPDGNPDLFPDGYLPIP